MTNPIDKLAALARREHGYEENGWVCNDKLWPERKWQCGCGADDHNAQVDAVIAGLGGAKVMRAQATFVDGGRAEFVADDSDDRYEDDRTYLVIELLEPLEDFEELPKTEDDK